MERPYPFFFSQEVSDARRFYLDLNPGNRKRFSLIGGGWEQCLPTYDLKRDGFPYTIIEFVARGEGRLVLRQKEYPLVPGTVFTYGKDVPHRITASREHGLTKFFVAVTGSEAAELLEECHILTASLFHVRQPERVRQVFNDLVDYGLSDHPNRARLCRVAFQYLVMKISDLALPEGDSSIAGETYQRCRQFIEEEYRGVRSLQEVAERCHVDSAYLCRLFKRFRRQTPFQYLQQLQMNAAVDLLQNGHRTVKEAAQELGFSDPYNFSRTFKRIFGIPPSKLAHGGSGANPPMRHDTRV